MQTQQTIPVTSGQRTQSMSMGPIVGSSHLNHIFRILHQPSKMNPDISKNPQHFTSSNSPKFSWSLHAFCQVSHDFSWGLMGFTWFSRILPWFCQGFSPCSVWFRPGWSFARRNPARPRVSGCGSLEAASLQRPGHDLDGKPSTLILGQISSGTNPPMLAGKLWFQC